jgi:nucleoside-diphosphate-sugar epimerase
MADRYRVLVTGASGFIGQHVLCGLIAQDHQVMAAARRPVSFIPAAEPVVIKDLSGGVDWVPILQDIDVVVHLAGIAHRGAQVEEGIYDKINRQATADLARAAAAAGVRLIFMSSVAAQSPPSSKLVLTEEDDCQPSGSYGRSKRNAELDIMQIGGHYIILRPALVYGAGVKGNMRGLIELARLPLPLPFGAVNNKRNLLAIENLVAAVCLLIKREDIFNQVFLIADATPVSLSDIVRYLRIGMGRSANLIAVPPPLLEAAFRLLQMPARWQRLAGNLLVSTDRLKALGYAPVVEPSEALAAMTRTR